MIYLHYILYITAAHAKVIETSQMTHALRARCAFHAVTYKCVGACKRRTTPSCMSCMYCWWSGKHRQNIKQNISEMQVRPRASNRMQRGGGGGWQHRSERGEGRGGSLSLSLLLLVLVIVLMFWREAD